MIALLMEVNIFASLRILENPKWINSLFVNKRDYAIVVKYITLWFWSSCNRKQHWNDRWIQRRDEESVRNDKLGRNVLLSLNAYLSKEIYNGDTEDFQNGRLQTFEHSNESERKAH